MRKFLIATLFTLLSISAEAQSITGGNFSGGTAACILDKNGDIGTCSTSINVGTQGVAIGSSATSSPLAVGSANQLTIDNSGNLTTTGNVTAANSAPSRAAWVSGRYYTAEVAPLTTVNSYALSSGPYAGFTFMPVYVPYSTTLSNIAFEITTAVATSFNVRMCVYPSVNGVPDNQSPIIDSGTIALTSSQTGEVIQPAASWVVGSGSTVIPAGMVWVALEMAYESTGVVSVRSVNAGSAGGGTSGGDIGQSFTSGASTSGNVIVGRYIANFTYAACPSSFTTSFLAANSNVPAVWLGK